MSICTDHKSLASLGGRTGLPYSAAWYWRLVQESARLTEMAQKRPFEDHPDWLSQPIDRRERALKRFEVMTAYDLLSDPGEAEALQAARAMGVTISQFYRIRKRWKSSQTIFELLPYRALTAPRGPRVDRAVLEEMTSIITRLIQDENANSPGVILRLLEQTWSLPQPLPSHMTIRKHITLVMQQLAGRAMSLRGLEDADAFGKVLVADHAYLAMFVATDMGPVRPLVTLAIDAFASEICGYHLSFGNPEPENVERALVSAVTRSKKLSLRGQGSAQPKLILEAVANKRWSALLDKIGEGGYEANISSTRRLHGGHYISAHIGMALGPLKFLSRAMPSRRAFDPAKDALISFNELVTLIERALTEWNSGRMHAAGEERPSLTFAFLEGSMK